MREKKQDVQINDYSRSQAHYKDTTSRRQSQVFCQLFSPIIQDKWEFISPQRTQSLTEGFIFKRRLTQIFAKKTLII